MSSSQTSSSGIINTDYIKSPLGIITPVEILLSLITFICAIIWRYTNGAEWIQFVSIVGFILALLFYLLHIFNVFSKLPQAVPWALIEFIIWVVWSVFFLISGIVAAVAASKFRVDSIIATAVFCFLSLIAWVIATIFLFKFWKDGGGNVTVRSTSSTTTTTTTTTANLS